MKLSPNIALSETIIARNQKITALPDFSNADFRCLHSEVAGE